MSMPIERMRKRLSGPCAKFLVLDSIRVRDYHFFVMGSIDTGPKNPSTGKNKPTIKRLRAGLGAAAFFASLVFAQGIGQEGPHLGANTAAGTLPVLSVRLTSQSGGEVRTSETRPDLVTSLESSEKVAFIKSFSLTVTVKNTGTAPSPESLCEITVRNAHAPRQLLRKFEKKIRDLTPGDSFGFSFPLKLGMGSFEICATVDPKKKIPEQNEDNNRSCITIAGK
jgi:hypothetical protein